MVRARLLAHPSATLRCSPCGRSFTPKEPRNTVALFSSHLRKAGAKTGGISPTAKPCRVAVGYNGCVGLHIHVGAQGMSPKQIQGNEWRKRRIIGRIVLSVGRSVVGWPVPFLSADFRSFRSRKLPQFSVSFRSKKTPAIFNTLHLRQYGSALTLSTKTRPI